MGYTVPKSDYDNKLKPALENAGVGINTESRGDERDLLNDFVGAIYPGESVLTDFVYFESSNDAFAKAEIDRLGLRYYAPNTGDDTIGVGGGINPGGCILLLIGLAMAAAAFMR